MKAALVALVLLTGCAGAVAPLERIRTPLNVLGEKLSYMQSRIVAMCRASDPPAPPVPAECSWLVPDYNDVQSAARAAQDGVDTVEGLVSP